MIIGTILVIMSAYFCVSVICAEKREKRSFTNKVIYGKFGG